MANHHYIAETYLKHFAREGLLRAYRKHDGKQFPCRPQDVCHEWNGDLNPKWLKEPDLLGQFRAIFEPHWNAATDALLRREISAQDKMIIAGYLANLATCTPGWRRVCVSLSDASHHASLSFAKRMKEKHGGDPRLPIDAIEAIERGEIAIDTDADFIRAILARNLMDHAWHAYHQDWTIIRNESEYPFVTSDNPLALQLDPEGHELLARYLPITPTVCLAVACARCPLPTFDPTLSPSGKIRWASAAKKQVKLINRLVVQCAESLVFSPERSEKTARLVQNYARYRVEGEFVEMPAATPNAFYHASKLRIRQF